MSFFFFLTRKVIVYYFKGTESVISPWGGGIGARSYLLYSQYSKVCKSYNEAGPDSTEVVSAWRAREGVQGRQGRVN